MVSAATSRTRSFWAFISAARPTSGDRKSTRLNSSHGYISYAVFCLKKKKKYYNQPELGRRAYRSIPALIETVHRIREHSYMHNRFVKSGWYQCMRCAQDEATLSLTT